MKASELRIGNWVQCGDGVTIVCGIEQDETFLNNGVQYRNDAIQPIPLTEEWLVKFGFELEKGLYIKYFDGNDFIGIDSEDFSVGTYANGRIAHCPQPSRMTLHQLQNLYSALTNEELTT
jgi:hypothetical protein